MKTFFLFLAVCCLTACHRPDYQPSFSVCGKLSEYPAVIKAGYDGMELIIGDFLVPDKSEAVFLNNLEQMKRLDAKIVSCMQFYPASLKITGPEIMLDEALAWAETTFRRAQMANVPYIVLGSGDARMAPDGFDKQEAARQFTELCRLLAPIAQKYDVVVLVEPLAQKYSNIILTLGEGAAIVEAVNHPHVQLLCDIHHMLLEDDPPDEIIKYGKYIRHCHIAEKDARTAPGTFGDDFRPYFKALRQINYRGSISVEIDYVNGKYQWDDFDKQSVSALQYMKRSWSDALKTDAHVTVDISRIRHTMQGGMGASWHAIIKELHELPVDEHYKYPLLYERNRGSAFGGNPPVADTSAWRQIKQYASWLGMNFMRVELSRRMFEPEQGKYDWENDEMQALFLILDWCQQHDADVFLQQMWGFVAWNACPGVHPLISAPRDLDAFAYGIADLLDYLVKKRGYTCIKYFCMVNEPPGGTWGYWWEYGDEKGAIDDAWKRLKEVFNERGITILLSGPDWTDMPPFIEKNLTFAPFLGSIDIHSYRGVNDDGEANLKKWSDWAHAAGKPFFLTEYGNMNLGWGGSHPAPKSFEAALSNANDVIRALRAGVDGVNRWSYTNKGDLDGQWQLIRTYDFESKQYLKEVTVENEAFYGFGILSRFLSKHSSVAACSKSLHDSVLMSTALLSPKGELSIFLVNLSDSDLPVNLEIKSFSGKRMNVYQVTKDLVTQPGFELNVLYHFKPSQKKTIALPAKSITTVSSYLLKHDENGII